MLINFQNSFSVRFVGEFAVKSLLIIPPHLECVQGSHKPGKPGKPRIVREFCKPGKVREFEIWSGNFFITFHVVCDLLIDELTFACNV